MSTKVKELPDDATHEQIVEVIDQLVVKKGEESGEQQADKEAENNAGEKTGNTDHTKTKAGDEIPAGDDSVVKKKDGEDLAEQEDEGQDWLDDDLKAEVATLGISDEQLSEFGSREELDRAMRLLDAAAMNAGRKAGETDGDGKQEDGKQTQLPEEPARGADGKFLPKPQKQQGEEANGEYKVQLDPETYDEEVVKEINNLHNHYKSRLQALDERFARLEQADQEREAQAAEERFDSIVDGLGQADLFGESGKETKQQLANRSKLFDEHQVYLAGLKALGREGRTDKAFVTRVLNMTFADHLSKQQQQQLTRKMSRQSKVRLGHGTVKPADQEPSVREQMRALHKELEEQSE